VKEFKSFIDYHIHPSTWNYQSSASFTPSGQPNLSTNTLLPWVRGIKHTSSLRSACVCTNLGPLIIQTYAHIRTMLQLCLLFTCWCLVKTLT